MHSFLNICSRYTWALSIIFLLYITSCKDRGHKSTGKCENIKAEDYYYSYLPRIDPLTGDFAWKTCSVNSQESYRISCDPLELDDESFLFVRTRSNGFYEKLEFLPPSKGTPESKRFDPENLSSVQTDGVYHFYWFVSLYDLRKKENYQGDKFNMKKVFRKPREAIFEASLYDSLWRGNIPPETLKLLSPDPITGDYCKRIPGLGKSLCDDPEFKEERCGTIPCYAVNEELNPFNFSNEYGNDNIYPLTKSKTESRNYAVTKADADYRKGHVVINIKSKLDHNYSLHLIGKELYDRISLDKAEDSTSRKKVRFCDNIVGIGQRSRKYVVSFPLGVSKSDNIELKLFDNADSTYVSGYNHNLTFGSPNPVFQGRPNDRFLPVRTFFGGRLNPISDLKITGRNSFEETLRDAFSLNEKRDYSRKQPIDNMYTGIYFSLEDKLVNNECVDGNGNLKLSAEKIKEFLIRNFNKKDNYTEEELLYGYQFGLNTTLKKLKETIAPNETGLIYPNSCVLADEKWIPLKTNILGVPVDTAYKALGNARQLFGSEGPVGFTGPADFNTPGSDIYTNTDNMSIAVVFKERSAYLSSGSELTVNNSAAITIAHEIGHLWLPLIIIAIDKIPDLSISASTRHNYYCSGINATRCVFRYFDNPEKLLEAYIRHNKAGIIWCEGHQELMFNEIKRRYK